MFEDLFPSFVDDRLANQFAKSFDEGVVEFVVHLQTFFSTGSQSAFGEKLEMLRNVGLIAPGFLDDLTDVPLSLHERAKDRQSSRVGQHPKLLGHQLQKLVGYRVHRLT